MMGVALGHGFRLEPAFEPRLVRIRKRLNNAAPDLPGGKWRRNRLWCVGLAALGRRGQDRPGAVMAHYRANLSIQADTKASRALAESGFSALKNVADGLANRGVLQAARHVADRRQAA